MPRKTSMEDIVKRAKERYAYAKAEWAHVYDNGDIDADFAAGNPWSPEALAARNAAERPALVMDELGQYINQAINALRANKRGPKLEPEANKTDQNTAYYAEGRIRQIENKSTAQAAYVTMFENQIVRGFGFTKLSAEYLDGEDWNQELRVERVPDANTILIDPDFKQADARDIRYAFELRKVPQDVFQSEYPNAEKRSFNADDVQLMGAEWYDGKNLLIANYWEQESEVDDVIYRLDSEQVPTIKRSQLGDADEVQEKRDKIVFTGEDGSRIEVSIIGRREKIKKTVKMYQLNGFEVLKVSDWPDPAGEIPIFPAFGKEVYANVGAIAAGRPVASLAGRKRHFESLVRRARDAFMAYCYARSGQFEFTGMIPKSPAVTYKGQLANCEGWDTAHKVPRAYLEVNAYTEEYPAGSGAPLPKPEPRNFDASPIVIMGQLCEELKRAIQSAMGSFNTAVGREDANVKSGIAIGKLQNQAEQGNYHFMDNFERALARLYRTIDRMLPVYDDTPGERAIRTNDDTSKVVQINQAPQQQPGMPGMPPNPSEKPDVFSAAEHGVHGVVVSTGPAAATQASGVEAVLDAMLQNPAIVQMALSKNPNSAPVILSTAIKMRGLGPQGDAIADAINPPEQDGGMPPQAQQAIQQAQQEVQKLQAENAELKSGLVGKQMDNDTKLKIAELQASVELITTDVKAQMQASTTQLQEMNAAIQSMHAAMSRPQMPPAGMLEQTPPIDNQNILP